MQPEFWAERWKNSQIGFHQQDINASLQTYWPQLELPAGARVFVPLCGKSRDMLWLRARGHYVLGTELVRQAVQDFFFENNLTPTVTSHDSFERWSTDGIAILCGDIFALTAADLAGVAGVYDRASLIAFPRELRQRYVDKLSDILPSGSETLLITIRYPKDEMQGPPFSVADEEVHELYDRKFEVTRVSERDALAGNKNLRDRGLTQLTELVYRIHKRRS